MALHKRHWTLPNAHWTSSSLSSYWTSRPSTLPSSLHFRPVVKFCIAVDYVWHLLGIVGNAETHPKMFLSEIVRDLLTFKVYPRSNSFFQWEFQRALNGRFHKRITMGLNRQQCYLDLHKKTMNFSTFHTNILHVADSAQTEYCSTFHCSSVCPSIRPSQA